MKEGIGELIEKEEEVAEEVEGARWLIEISPFFLEFLPNLIIISTNANSENKLAKGNLKIMGKLHLVGEPKFSPIFPLLNSSPQILNSNHCHN